MKQVLVICIAFLLFSSAILSQTMSFSAYELTLRNMSTGEMASKSVELTIHLTDYTLDILNTTEPLKWTFTGTIIKTSKTQFFVYADDIDGIRCRIWFQAITETSAIFGIEYSDYAIIYKVYLNN